MLNKQNPNTTEMSILRESIAAISQRRFFGSEPAPLPSYILFALTCGNSELLFNIMIRLFYMLTCAITLIAHKKLSYNTSLISSVLLFFSIMSLGLFIPPTNMVFSICFSASFLFFLITKRHWCASVIVGAAISSGPHGITCVLTFFILSIFKFFIFASNPQNNVKKVVNFGIFSIVQVFFIPFIIFLLIKAGDLRIRNIHSNNARQYPLEFQSSLSKFLIEYSVNPEFKIIAPEPENGTIDAYVMDRSIVSVMNVKHKGFLFHSNGNDTQKIQFEIQKVHENEFDTEEPRFIKNGNIIKLKSTTSDLFLGLTNKENSEDKFIDASFGTFSDDNDFWRVECSEELQIRREPVKFKHVNTGLVLCCTRTKGILRMHGSVYSEMTSRLFYITHNTNHSYFKNNFKNEHARATASEFPKLKYTTLLWQFIKGKRGGPSEALEEQYGLFYSYSGLSEQLYKRLGSGIFYVSFLFTFILMVFLFFNHVSDIRYKVSFKLPENVMYVLVFMLSCLVCTLLIGVDRHYLTFYSTVFNFAIMLVFEAQAVIAFDAFNPRKDD